MDGVLMWQLMLWKGAMEDFKVDFTIYKSSDWLWWYTGIKHILFPVK